VADHGDVPVGIIPYFIIPNVHGMIFEALNLLAPEFCLF